MENTQSNEYLDHLNSHRWCLIKHINGTGIEVSNNPFVVLPKAIKILQKDNPTLYEGYARFLVNDFLNPLEIEDNTLDYVFITMEDIPYDTIKTYLNKVVTGGKVLVHTKDAQGWKFLMYQRDGAAIVLTNPEIETRPTKNVGLVRLGAIGDLLQTASVARAFKKQGYHVTVYAQQPASSVLENNPDIDEIVATDRDIVRNSELRMYWDWLATKHAKFTNLCGTVEDALLPGASRPHFYWPVSVRNRYLNTNYVQFMHEVAEVPYKLDVHFYPTEAEIVWAKNERKKFAGKKLLCYSLSGSSLHKAFPYVDEYIARVMIMLKDVDVVLMGGEHEAMLQGGWQDEPRVHLMAGVWSIRQSLAFVKLNADLLVGPETGILNAMCCEKLNKIIFLSHSTKNNLTRDWINTVSLEPPKGTNDDCLHRLHANVDGWKYLIRDEVTGAHYGQAQIDRDALWAATFKVLK